MSNPNQCNEKPLEPEKMTKAQLINELARVKGQLHDCEQCLYKERDQANDKIVALHERIHVYKTYMLIEAKRAGLNFASDEDQDIPF